MTSKFVDAAAAAKYVADHSGSSLERMLGKAVYTWLIESRSKPRGFAEAVDRRVQDLNQDRVAGITVDPFDHREGGEIRVSRPFQPDETMSTAYIGVQSLREKFPLNTIVEWYADAAQHEGPVIGYEWNSRPGIGELLLRCSIHENIGWTRRAEQVLKKRTPPGPITVEYRWEEAEYRRQHHIRIFRVERQDGRDIRQERFATVYDLELGRKICDWLNLNRQLADLEDL